MVEGSGVEETAQTAFAWDNVDHGLAQDVCNGGQEDLRDVDDLRLEVEDFLQDAAKDGQAQT